MLAQRIRPQWSPEQLAEIYASPFDHNALGDGPRPRIELSTWMGQHLHEAAGLEAPAFIADLSCGNGEVAIDIAKHFGRQPLLGEFAPGHQVHGPIEQTILQIEHCDLFVCLETLEHLWEPYELLQEIRERAGMLLCSVPLWERAEQEQNGEHYWAFDQRGFERCMLEATGWTPVLFASVPGYPVGGDGGFYQTGIWGCV